MTVRSVPIFLQAKSHPAEETRLMLGGMLGAATGSFSGGVASSDPAHGVVRPTDLAVTQNGTPNMSVNVAAGGCFIRGTLSANQGAYHLWNDATVNLAISAADATNGRRDLVIAQVRDSGYSGATDDARITVVTGTPAASPADPSLASYPNALVLARITVAAGDTAINTADITDLRPLANVRNSVPVFDTYAARSTAIPSPYNGQLSAISAAWTTNGIEQYNGTSWRLPWNMPWGVVFSTYSTYTSGLIAGEQIVANGSSTAFIANRRYRWTYNGCAYGDTANSLFQIKLRATSTSGTTYGAARGAIPPSPFQGVAAAATVFTPGSITFTPIATIERIAGGGNVGVTLDHCVIIEDIGPSGAPV